MVLDPMLYMGGIVPPVPTRVSPVPTTVITPRPPPRPIANGAGPAPTLVAEQLGMVPELPGTELGDGILGGILGAVAPWVGPLLGVLGGGILGGLLGGDDGGGETPGALLPGGVLEGPGALIPGVRGGGSNWEAFADFGGFGKGSPQAEGWIGPGRTTDGTGFISAETFRAWDPIQQRYYQLHGNNPYSNITLMPGRVLPGIGGFITKTWVTHAWRKDGSLASTQMAMTSTGRMISLSETGVMKNWRPYKSIVIGKSLTTSNLRRISTKVKSHAKSLKKLLTILK